MLPASGPIPIQQLGMFNCELNSRRLHLLFITNVAIIHIYVQGGSGMAYISLRAYLI